MTEQQNAQSDRLSSDTLYVDLSVALWDEERYLEAEEVLRILRS